MQDRTRYAQLLGSEDPWRVTEVTLRCLLRDPQSGVASLNERPVVLGPVIDSIRRLVLGVDSRFHVEIVAQEACAMP